MKDKFVSFRADEDIQKILDDIPHGQKSDWIKQAIKDSVEPLPESQSTRGPPGEKNDVHAKNTGVEHDSPGAGASEPPVEEEEAPGESPVGDFQGKLPVLVGGEGVQKSALGVITGGRGGSTGEPTTKGAS